MLPDARIVYLVRDPVQRIVSHYLHWVASEREERSFDEVVTDLASELDPVEEAGSLDEHPGYLRRSMYFEQVQQWREVFSDEQITVIDLAELTEDRAATLARLAAFLGVSGRLPPSAARTSQNRSEDMRRVSPLGAHIRRSGGTAVAKALPTSIRRPLAAAFSRTVDQVPPRPIPTSEQIRWIGELLGPDLREFRAYTGRDFGDWCV
jgi:hypothetical protein